MAFSLYDVSVDSYLRTTTAIAAVLETAEAHFSATGVDLEEIAAARLCDDMAQFRFQVACVAHHSLEAVRACASGSFGPPEGFETLGWAELKALLRSTLDGLGTFEREAVDALAGGRVVFRLGETEIPFTTENFILGFSLPNFYFHATTTYDILRARGVPIGKRDFLGQLRIG